MSCAASYAISEHYAEIPLWKALGSCFLILHLWNLYVQHGSLLLCGDGTDPGSGGSHPTVVASHCVIMQFNLGQVFAQRLQKKEASVSNVEVQVQMCSNTRCCINRTVCLFWLWAEGAARGLCNIVATNAMFVYLHSTKQQRHRAAPLCDFMKLAGN